MIFLNAQPDILYYHWQVELQIYNFTRLGIQPKQLHFIFNAGKPSVGLKKLKKRYPKVNFFWYPDTRIDKTYISSIRPHILEKHFKLHPKLIKEIIFYHDCDIIFRELPDFDRMIKDEIWYLSDTNSYVNSTYVKSKGIEIFNRMCKIAKVLPSEIEAIDQDSGGAQYLMKNVSSNFWKKVDFDALELYKYMTSSIPYFTKKFEHENPGDKKYHPIQAWCADMWAVLWNAIYFGNTVKIDPELSFSWATSQASEFEKHKIFHNAGVTSSHPNFKELFFKGDYQKVSPFEADLSYVSPKYCSYFYVQEILAAKKFISEKF